MQGQTEIHQPTAHSRVERQLPQQQTKCLKQFQTAEINVHPQIHTDTQTEQSLCFLCKIFFFADVNVSDNITVQSVAMCQQVNEMVSVRSSCFSKLNPYWPHTSTPTESVSQSCGVCVCEDKHDGSFYQTIIEIITKIIGHCDQFHDTTYCTYMGMYYKKYSPPCRFSSVTFLQH